MNGTSIERIVDLCPRRLKKIYGMFGSTAELTRMSTASENQKHIVFAFRKREDGQSFKPEA